MTLDRSCTRDPERHGRTWSSPTPRCVAVARRSAGTASELGQRRSDVIEARLVTAERLVLPRPCQSYVREAELGSAADVVAHTLDRRCCGGGGGGGQRPPQTPPSPAPVLPPPLPEPGRGGPPP